MVTVSLSGEDIVFLKLIEVDKDSQILLKFLRTCRKLRQLDMDCNLSTRLAKLCIVCLELNRYYHLYIFSMTIYNPRVSTYYMENVTEPYTAVITVILTKTREKIHDENKR